MYMYNKYFHMYVHVSFKKPNQRNPSLPSFKKITTKNILNYMYQVENMVMYII